MDKKTRPLNIYTTLNNNERIFLTYTLDEQVDHNHQWERNMLLQNYYI